MALKPDRRILDETIEYFGFSVMERGGVVCTSGTPGSGSAMDSSAQAVEYVPNASGKAAVGMLMNDFVNNDLARTPINWLKDEQQIGTKANIMTKGWGVTNQIVPGAATGTMPCTAYVKTSGQLTDLSGAGLPSVGRFHTRPDADGYAKIYIDLA